MTIALQEPDAPAHSMSLPMQAFPAACDEPSSATNIRPMNEPVGGTSAGDDSDRKLRTLSRTLSRKIKTGQKKREEREGKRGYVDPNNYTHIIFQCMQQATDKGFDVYLDRVEHALAAEVQESKIKRRAWTSWFILSCLQLIRDKRRGGRKRLPARGAKLVNLIVDRLLISEGAAAMGVYDALAENCHKLRQGSECSSKDIERLAGLVSEELRGEIRVPLNQCWLPLPGVLLSSLFTKIPYHTICEDIGLPNLALLQFTPSPSEGSLVVGSELSTIRDECDSFPSRLLGLQEIRERNSLGDSTAATDLSHSVLSTTGEQEITAPADLSHSVLSTTGEQEITAPADLSYSVLSTTGEQEITAPADLFHSMLSTAGEQGITASGQGHSGGYADDNITTIMTDLDVELQEIRDNTAAADFSHSIQSIAGEKESSASGQGHSGGYADYNITTIMTDLDVELQEIRDNTAAADFSHSIQSIAGEKESSASGQGHSGGHADYNITKMMPDIDGVVEKSMKHP